jgi:hypothetical protein
MYCVLCLEVAKSLCKTLINYSNQNSLCGYKLMCLKLKHCLLVRLKTVENLLIYNLIEHFTYQSGSDQLFLTSAQGAVVVTAK